MFYTLQVSHEISYQISIGNADATLTERNMQHATEVHVVKPEHVKTHINAQQAKREY